MPITRIDVCDLIHIRSEESLEISSSCSIVLSHSVKTGSVLDEIASASYRPTFEKLWVQRGSRLHLSIALVLDAFSLSNQEKDDFVDRLGTSFTDAELWRQLGLQSSFSLPIETNIISDGFKRIELSILHTDATDTAREGLRKQIIANTRPPDGVPTADLQEISIIWALSPIISSSSDRDSKRVDCGTLIVNAEEFVSLLDDNDSHGYVSLFPPSLRLPFSDMEPHHVWPTSVPVISGTDKQMLDEVTEEPQEKSIVSLLSTQASTARVLQQRQPLDLRRKRPRSISSPLFDLSAAQKMIGIAFHEIVSGRNISDPPTCAQATVVARPKLAEISPALFSPGYLQAISRQSQSISTIAYSMASVNRRTKSRPLRDSFALLWATGPATDIFGGEPPPPEAKTHAESLASIIKTRTWMIMQRLLFEPAAAARLKPLACSVSQGAEELFEVPDECSSSVTLAEAPMDVSSPAAEILDDFFLFEDDFELLLEESDDELLLDEYEADQSTGKNNPDPGSYASSNCLSARHPMSQRYHRGPFVADKHDTKTGADRAQSEFPDILDAFCSDGENPIDNDSPFEALETPDVSSIGCAERFDTLSDLDAEEMLLDDPSNDGGRIIDHTEFRDTMDLLDHLSVDDGRASVDEVHSEPDEMLDSLGADDEMDDDWSGQHGASGCYRTEEAMLLDAHCSAS
ncbi:hypothetical protein MMC18_005094 [Xylographa bjoerkii]|nr:hypothetical protein [Xylographa bjoerkii]